VSKLPPINTRLYPGLLIITALVALITLPSLSTFGLSSSEGHRVIPALEMLESNKYLVPHLFDQPYLRKPQLVPWIYAAALSIYPDPDLMPRLVSAFAFLLLCISSFFFARKWFGPRAALPAGLATALTPLFWAPARSAEIESIHNLFTALGAWITLELLITTTKRPIAFMLALFAAALLMLLTKGPAGFPIFLALILSAALLTRSPKPLFKPTILVPIAFAALVFALHWSRTLSAAPNAITQSPDAFMFEPGRITKLIAFIPVALFTALPVTLALMFPWGKDARNEADEYNTLPQLHAAKLLALSIPLALLIMMIAGVSNDRYAQPILAATSPLIGWLLTTNLHPTRRLILRLLTLGSPKILAAAIIILIPIFILKVEPLSKATSGKHPALTLAKDLAASLPPGNYTIVADAMIEARPETLLYLSDQAHTTYHDLTIRWTPELPPEQLTDIATTTHTQLLALIRTDQNGNESDKVLIDKTLATGTVHEFDFALVSLKQP
jgi:4-amino-4-deoxy-L-arabinose transferase-like glycosyltransferase